MGKVSLAIGLRILDRGSVRETSGIMGKGYKLKEVVYTLSPFEHKIMSTLWSQFAYKTKKRISENWVNVATLVSPVAGTYMYAQNYVEKEKLHHRD